MGKLVQNRGKSFTTLFILVTALLIVEVITVAAQPSIANIAIDPFNRDYYYVSGTVNVTATVTPDLFNISSVFFTIFDYDLNCQGIQDENDASLWSCSIDTTLLSDSNDERYDVAVTATDSDTNSVTEYYSSFDNYFDIDNTPPETSNDYQYDDTWQTAEQTITLDPADQASGVASTYYCSDTENTCQPDVLYENEPTISSEGRTYLRYYSRDNLGNQEDTKFLTIKIDTTAPAHNYTIVSPSRVANNSTITLTTKFDDTGSGVSSISGQIQSGPFLERGDQFNLLKSGKLWTLTFNIGDLAEGIYKLVLVAADHSGNTLSSDTKNFTVVAPSNAAEGSETNNAISLDSSVVNELAFKPTSSTFVNLSIVSTSDVSGGTISISEYSTAGNTSSAGILDLRKYIEIEASPDLTASIDFILIKVGYSDEEVAAAGLSESTLRLYYYNTSSGLWQEYAEPNGGVNMDANYVWANSTHFSTWGIFGTAPPASPSPGGGGGGGGWGSTEPGVIYRLVCGDGTCARGYENANSCPLDCASPSRTPSATPPSPGPAAETPALSEQATATQPLAPTSFAAITGAITANMMSAINKVQWRAIAAILLVISIGVFVSYRVFRTKR